MDFCREDAKDAKKTRSSSFIALPLRALRVFAVRIRLSAIVGAMKGLAVLTVSNRELLGR
jgi:hypothetical protein